MITPPSFLVHAFEETSDTEDVPPFYVSLKIHDMNLHNAMLDSGIAQPHAKGDHG
jgi:hypothetical protein